MDIEKIYLPEGAIWNVNGDSYQAPKENRGIPVLPSSLYMHASLLLDVQSQNGNSRLTNQLIKYERSQTPADGNCLYHALYQSRNPGNEVSLARAINIRQDVFEWIYANTQEVHELAKQYGTDINELAETIGTTGNWNNDAGDLVPSIISRALNINIEIIDRDSGRHLFNEGSGNPVLIYRNGDHYSVDETF